MTRLCAWCGKPFEARREHALFCCDAHRAAAWKAHHLEEPVDCSEDRAERVLKTVKRSGRQLSYRRAVEELAMWLTGQGHDPDCALSEATAVLSRALPERQRQRLEAM